MFPGKLSNVMMKGSTPQSASSATRPGVVVEALTEQQSADETVPGATPEQTPTESNESLDEPAEPLDSITPFDTPKIHGSKHGEPSIQQRRSIAVIVVAAQSRLERQQT